MELAQLSFTFLYVVFYGLIITRSLIWLPFTPSHTSGSDKWMDWNDIIRWLLSGIFLIILPAFYYLYVVYSLSMNVPILQFPSAFWEIDTFFSLILIVVLILPPLGMYDLWQVLVRAWPNFFYSNQAMMQIEKVYSGAFKSGKAITLAIGLIWLFVPIVLLLILEIKSEN